MKAPWRKTRFQRLKEELALIEKQSLNVGDTLKERKKKLEQLQAQTEAESREDEMRPREEVGELEMPSAKRHRSSRSDTPTHKELEATAKEIKMIEDSKMGIDNWKRTLKLQHDAFKLVFVGSKDGGVDVADLEKQQIMHRSLEDGQALEEDELKAQGLEDHMACVIQRSMKRALGRSIRRAIIAKQHSAAQKLQNFVRKKANEGLAYERGIRYTLAIKVQKRWRGRRSGSCPPNG